MSVIQDPSGYIGREMGTVTILRLLGQGAMAAVFIAYQRTLKRQVAVKILPKTASRSGQSREQFQQEAEVVAGLSHPNIVPIFEMGEEDDCYYQVMQLVKGLDLETTINNRLKHPVPAKRLFPARDSIKIVQQILDGLGSAHEEGVVHRDIKPANILMERQRNRPLISDFGIAQTLQSGNSSESTVVGSPLYMAPECVSGNPVDWRTDIYSVAVILLRLLCGTLPLATRDAMALLAAKMESPERVFTTLPSQASPFIDEALEHIILRGLAPDPLQRHQSCAEFQEELCRWTGPAP